MRMFGCQFCKYDLTHHRHIEENAHEDAEFEADGEMRRLFRAANRSNRVVSIFNMRALWAGSTLR